MRALETALRSAVRATGASAGWIAWQVGDELEVCVYAGPNEPDAWLGRRFTTERAGTAGMVLGTGQPMAVRPRPEDRLVTEGPMGLLGRVPTCYVSVPCSEGSDPVGVLEVVDKHDRLAFDFDDVDLLALLGDIVGALLVERRQAASMSGPTVDPTLARFASAPEHVRSAVASLLDAVGRAE